MADVKLKLKLLVDKEENSVLLAEAENDFTDILFSFLTLPMGTIIRVLNKQSSVGCMDKLYESVEKLDLQFMETKACKSILLHPKNAAERSCEDLKFNIDNTVPRMIYGCPTWSCCKSSRVYSAVEGARCPKCGLTMDKQIEQVKTCTEEDGVFAKGKRTFTISDDLRVVLTSTDTTLSLLCSLGVTDSTVLEEMNIEIRKEEMLSLLKRSLSSETPLTDAFLRKLDVSRDADMPKKNQVQPPVKCDAATDTKGLKMKLVLSKSKNIVLYAEAGKEIVDFLFSFLTFPVGTIVKLLDKYSCMACLDNLYKSIEDLTNTDNSVHSDNCTNMLLSPKLAPCSACTSQLLSVYEEVSRDCTITGCYHCLKQKFVSRATNYCKHGVEDINLSAINLKLPSSGTECGGGFTKKGVVFMITDELEVKPLSSISSIHSANKAGIPISDLFVREVSLGEPEGLKLLKASLISKQVLTNVFCKRDVEGENYLKEQMTLQFGCFFWILGF